MAAMARQAVQEGSIVIYSGAGGIHPRQQIATAPE
jgi:hypothetical protein